MVLILVSKINILIPLPLKSVKVSKRGFFSSWVLMEQNRKKTFIFLIVIKLKIIEYPIVRIRLFTLKRNYLYLLKSRITICFWLFTNNKDCENVVLVPFSIIYLLFSCHRLPSAFTRLAVLFDNVRFYLKTFKLWQIFFYNSESYDSLQYLWR